MDSCRLVHWIGSACIARRNPSDRALADGVIERVRRVEAVIEPYARLLRAEKIGTLEEELGFDEAARVFDAYVALIRELEVGEFARSDFIEVFDELTPTLEYER